MIKYFVSSLIFLKAISVLKFISCMLRLVLRYDRWVIRVSCTMPARLTPTLYSFFTSVHRRSRGWRGRLKTCFTLHTNHLRKSLQFSATFTRLTRKLFRKYVYNNNNNNNNNNNLTFIQRAKMYGSCCSTDTFCNNSSEEQVKRWTVAYLLHRYKMVDNNLKTQ